MKAILYYLVRKLFSPGYRNKLKITKYNLQKKLTPYYRWRYGNFTAAELEMELKSKLPRQYQSLMIHSAHSSLLPMYSGSLSELLQVFLNLGDGQRTLVMPAFFFGERKYNFDIAGYFQDKPFFDVEKTPSQTGMLTEMFRKLPGIKTSIHPTHRLCALGPLADELLKGHENCRTACGQGSPFEKMAAANTLVLGVGVHYYQSMTQTHATEEILFEQGKYPTKFDSVELPVTITSKNGVIHHKLTVLDKSPYQRQVHPLLQKVMGKELLQWKFHGVPMYLADTHRVTEKLNEAALAGKSAYF